MDDNTFQMKRFSGIVKQTLSNKKATFGIMLLLTAALPLLSLYKIMLFEDNYTYGAGIFYSNRQFYRHTIALFSILAPYLFFFNVNRVMKGVVQPTCHPSALEKFLNMTLFCFVLVPVSVAVVYGVSNHLFATFYPVYLYKFTLIELQHLFFGGLFTPVLILLMQTTFFFNLLYREKKVGKTIATFAVAVFMYILLDGYYLLWWGIPVFLRGPLLYILPVVLFVSSYFLLRRKDIQPVSRCDKCGAKQKRTM